MPISVYAATEVVFEAWYSTSIEISFFVMHLPLVKSQLKSRLLKTPLTIT
jgi:hypothetical protein